MSDESVYEDDEPIEDLRAAWNSGEKGTTLGPRDLNQRAKSIVDRAVARLEERHTLRLQVVSSGTSAKTTFTDPVSQVPAVEQVEDELVTALAYRVG